MKIKFSKSEKDKQNSMEKSFFRQVSTLLKDKCPKLMGISEEKFLNYFMAPLLEKIKDTDVSNSRIPFLIVIKQELLSLPTQMSLIQWQGATGSLDDDLMLYNHHIRKKIQCSIDKKIPKHPIYLCLGVEIEKEDPKPSFQNWLRQLKEENRSPLIAEEGIAILRYYPEEVPLEGILLGGMRCFAKSKLMSAHLYGVDRPDCRFKYEWSYGMPKPNLGSAGTMNLNFTSARLASCRERIQLGDEL